LRSTTATLTAVVVVVVGLLAVRPQPAVAHTPAVTLSATKGQIDRHEVDVGATGLANGVTYLVVECGPEAVTILAQHLPGGDINPEDGCESQQNTLLFTADGSEAHGRLQLRAMLNAAVGPIDCRVEACFVAFFALAGGAGINLVNISFAPTACAAPGSCQTGVQPGLAGRAVAASADPTPAPAPIASLAGPSSISIDRAAFVAGDLAPAGAITGGVTGPFEQLAPPAVSVAGEGIVRLDLSAPGTDWGANVASAVVVDVSVDGGAPQQIVLFRGATPFVYAGGVGPLSTGEHAVTVAIDQALSRTGAQTPAIEIHDIQLQVVTPSNPRYQAIAHAPIVYGRSTTALHDTPLLEYANASASGSSTHLGYTMVFSHENAGTAFVPFMESAVWGRMTDIESFFSLDAAADGTPSGATYYSGSVPDDYPDDLNAISEVDVPFTGSWDGMHPVVRDATGNNDFSQSGTTGFRLRPVPVSAPPSGRPREAAMDANPWTYRVMGDEVSRWYTNVTTDPLLPEQGDARQYAYVEISSSGSGVASLGVDVQLDGGPTWYANDFGGGYPIGGSGTSRTTIKLPTDWMGHTITAARVRVFPAGAASTVTVSSLRIFGLDQTWGFHEVTVPTPSIVAGFLFVPQPAAPVTTTTTSTTSDTTSTPNTTSPPPPTTDATTAPSGVPSTMVASSPVAPSGANAEAPPASALDAQPTYTG
jgi:hypothetical protein